jgi:N-acetylmuramoyl-L-alanine amidase
MKKVILGILLGMAIIGQPVRCCAADAVYPRTHEIKMNMFSQEDAQLLMGIAAAEAGNQGPDGMWLIMSTILNRVHSSKFPDNIHDVIFQQSQFYSQGIGKAEITPECREAFERIEQGDVAPQIIAFEKSDSNVLDKYFCEAFEYRDHKFYTLQK